MDGPLDAVLEIFTWVGLGAALLLAVIALIVWAVDGTWLRAEGLVDHEEDGTWVRWFDADGDANSAVASDHDAAKLTGLDRADIYYRLGWRGKMRLTRRHPALRAATWMALGFAAMSMLSFAASLVVMFVRG